MPTEAQEQQALLGWCQYNEGRWPELAGIYHIPNGGKRDMIAAVQMKRQGAKKGVPDLHLPVPKHGYCGLYLEMKIPGNNTSPEQNGWIGFLKGQGHAVYVAYGWVQASEIITAYMEGTLDGIEQRLTPAPKPRPKTRSARS